MRSDSLSDYAVFAELLEAMNKSHYFTPRLTREQRQMAIVGPDKVFGADRADAGQPAAQRHGSDPNQLPLMQHVLMRMWQDSSVLQTGASDGDETDGNQEWMCPLSLPIKRNPPPHGS